MKYLIAVKIDNNTEIFEFDKKSDRKAFIEDIKKFGDVEFATSETNEEIS